MFKSTTLQYQAVLILIILLAFFMRLQTLTVNPLWFDEAMEFWVATESLDQLLPTVKDSIQDPPFYSLLLHFWLHIGRDEFTLRLLSTFASLLSVATAFALGKQAHGRAAGLVAALLFAILPPDIRFAQEVGQYAFLVFTLLLNLLMMAYARQTNKWAYWLAWLATAVICFYNYYGSLLIITAVAGAVLLENSYKRNWRAVKKQSVALLIYVVLILPLIVFWVPDQLFRGPTQNAFQVTLNPLLTEVTTFLTRTKFLLAYQLTGFILDPSPWVKLKQPAWLLILIALFFCVIGLRKTKKHLFLIMWLLVATAVYYAVWRLGAYPYGGTRHALILTPLLILCVAIGIAAMWQLRHWLGVIMIVGVMSIALLAPQEPAEDLRTVTAQFLTKREENTPTYVYYGAVPGFRYQLQLQTDVEEEIPAIWYRDCWAGAANSFCAEDNIFYGRWLRQLSPEAQKAEILSIITPPSPEQFWLIFSHSSNEARDTLLSQFEGTYERVDAIEATGASAYLLQRR